MLSGLKKIIIENGSSKRDFFLEVNPYLHSSKKALQLIAGLNKPSSLVSKESNAFNSLDKIIFSYDFEKDCKNVFNDYRYTLSIREEYELMKTEVNSSHDEDWTRIVLGGEFSAGKSSFLNSLLCDEGEIEFLPVSDKPTSVIPTYIYCSKKQKMQYIIGENTKNGKMFLSFQALLALGHEFERKHQISLGLFLNKLIIQQPVNQNFLNDVVFVDTPGYNKEDGGSKRDKQTARNAVKTGEVLFWLIDIEVGTIKKEDLDFISDSFEKEKPKVIIFNKADKKTSKQISDIIQKAEIVLNANNDDTIIDILAYSSHERRILQSCKGNKDWKSLFEKVKSKGRKKKAEQDFMDMLRDFLEGISEQTVPKINELNELIKECNRQIINKNKAENCDISFIETEISRQYNRSLELKELCDSFQEVAEFSLRREFTWEKKAGLFENVEHLSNSRKRGFEIYSSHIQKDREVLSISEGFFKHLDNIQISLGREKNDILEGQKSLRDKCRKEINDSNGSLKKFNEIVNLIEMLLRKSVKVLNEEKSESNFGNLPIVGVVNPKGDIFNCIINNDFEGFLDCLSKKTEISNLKNKDGLNILSTAVMNRRYDMVNVLLPKALRLIDRKENNHPSAREIAENNHDHLMVELLTKSSN